MKIERYNPHCRVGLTTEQVQKRHAQNLVNYDNQPPTKTIKEIIVSNFVTYFNILNLVLGSAIIIGGIIGNNLLYSLKNCLFMGVIIVNSLISIYQEVSAKKTIDQLSVIAASKLKVIRNEQIKELTINEIVLDDILKLENGNQVVTDSLIQEGTVEVNESFITGESEPLVKKVGDLLLSGSFIVSGSCYAKVEHIGSDNYISTISSEAKYQKRVNSVIMNSFEKLLKVISIIIIPIGIILFITQLKVTNYDFSNSIISTVAALIGMIPEGLVLLTSSVMAVSVIRLSKYNVLVQQLYCIETLARVDVICLDKTGTITEGKMELSQVIAKQKVNNLPELLSNITQAFANSNATMEAIKDKYNSKPTLEVVDLIEFSSSRKFSAVAFQNLGSIYLGAPEFVLKENIINYQSEIADYGKDYRVLVLAYNSQKLTETPTDLTVLAFLLIQDKIRPSAPNTLNYFKQQGVTIKIISGDNHITVENIAKRAGLKKVKSIDATTIPDDNLDEIVENYDVFGRVTPDQKKKFIEALQRNKHTVAMTGDGVNDVLALKASDCSIAMASGSEAARNVSQLAEGRRTINNIERSSSLLLVKTIFTFLLIFVSIFMSEEYFFIPIQLTLITMFTIAIPSFILALEPNTELVRGNFLLKIIGKSLPAALTVVFNIIIIVLFQREFQLDEDLSSLLCVILTGTTGFIFLYRICKPFNLLRISLYLFLIIGFTYGVAFQYEFFDLGKINNQTILIFVVLFICSKTIFDKLNYYVGIFLDKVEQKYNI